MLRCAGKKLPSSGSARQHLSITIEKRRRHGVHLRVSGAPSSLSAAPRRISPKLRTGGTNLADYEPPADLLELKRAFLAAEVKRREVGQAMPAPTAVAAKEAELSDEERQAWKDACDESGRLASEIHRHPWWETVDNRYDADMQLLKLAKAD